MDVKKKFWTLKEKLYPSGFRHDASILVPRTFAFIISYVLSAWMLTTVSLVFISQLGAKERDGCALGLNVYNLIGNSFLVGLNFGCNTLLPQCFGGNKHKMGLIVQRAVIIVFYTCFVIWTLMLNAVSHILFVGGSFLRYRNTVFIFDFDKNSSCEVYLNVYEIT
jgi:Na+-driven multidrug efflux pump